MPLCFLRPIPLKRPLKIPLILLVLGLLLSFSRPFCCASPLPVGLLIDLSGPGSERGRAALRAARQAVSLINQQGGIKGRRLEILVGDTQGQKQRLLLTAQELSKKHHVIALIGPVAPGLSQTLHAYAETYQVPTILTEGMSPLFPIRGHRSINWTFASNPRLDSWLKALLSGLKQAGITSIGPLFQEGKGGETVALWLRAYSIEMGMRVLAPQTFSIQEADCKAQLEWFESQGAEASLVWGPSNWAQVILRSAMGKEISLVLCPYLITPLTTSTLAEKARIILVVPPVFMGEELPPSHPCIRPVIRFTTLMETNASNLSPQCLLTAGAYWDGLFMVSMALKKAEFITRKSLRDSLEALKEPFYGVMGVFQPDKRNHSGLRPNSLLVIRKSHGIWGPIH